MPDVLPVVLYGCETRSLTLREERRPRVFENRVLGGIFGRMRDEVTGEWRKVQMRILVINTPHQILFGKSNKKNEMGGACGTYKVGERRIQGFGGET